MNINNTTKTTILTAAAISSFVYKDFDKCPTLYTNPDGAILEKQSFFDIKNTEGVVYHDLMEDTVYIAFRGTSSVGDIMTDMSMTTKEFFGVKAHRGFVKAYKLTEDTISKIVECVLKNNECKRIIIYGHSLGGALANLAYLHIKNEFADKLNDKELTLITYGSPKVFVSRTITESIKSDFTSHAIRITHSDDIVPTLPKYSKFLDKILKIKYDHIGEHYSIGVEDDKGEISEHMLKSYIDCLTSGVIV